MHKEIRNFENLSKELVNKFYMYYDFLDVSVIYDLNDILRKRIKELDKKHGI